MDHPETYATVLESGKLILGRLTWTDAYMNERKKDVAWMLDQVTAWDGTDPLLKGRLDLDRIGIMGWSLGGGTAGETCRVQDRLKAVVFLDPFFGATPSLLSLGLNKPFLNMISGDVVAPNTALFNKATKDAYYLTIMNATHERFTDNAWIVSSTEATRRQALAMHACMVAFFEKHLRNIDNHLLDSPGTTLPDVVSFKSK
jgi:dienelactone hydrolase